MKIRIGWLWLGLLLFGGCRSGSEVVSIISFQSQAAAQASLVSVQAINAGTAEVIVKYSSQLKPADWQLTVRTASGAVLPLTSGQEQPFDLFILAPYRINGLTAGQIYRVSFRSPLPDLDSFIVERTYIHQPNSFWKRLAHLSVNEGDFTGSLLPVSGLGAYSQNTQANDTPLSAVRYVTSDRWQSLQYSTRFDEWMSGLQPGVTPRKGLIRFRLQAIPNVTYTFRGLGFLLNDRIPKQRLYLNDMRARDDQRGELSNLTPAYAGSKGDVVFFTTIDRAFLLTQEGSRELWIRRGDWVQYRGRDFPEVPGTLTTFVLNGIGYVVNQVNGRRPRLWAYDPERDEWTRRADFPGESRSRGIGLSVGGKGYFGLGVTDVDELSLRDLWQYDPASDRWEYITDYPGQGNRYLISYSLADRAYLGWGYESQASPSGGSRLVGCTDFWEFKP